MLVEIIAFRQGDFWPDAVHPGQVLDLPDDVARYLIEVGAATEPASEKQPALDKPKGKAKP